MRISFLCTDDQHPVNPHLRQWAIANNLSHKIEIVRNKNLLSGGDLLFLISCSEVVNLEDRMKYSKSLVLHASDLPKGRGWSPHIWELIDGVEYITLTLLEAEDKVDSGKVWKKIKIPVAKNLLWDEINELLFNAELALVDFAIEHNGSVVPYEQINSTEATYYPQRTKLDSLIDPDQSIASQFNKIRVCDPERFPAYFNLHGKKYKLILEKIDE
jgi:methionyl-tRNA formyltransferase